MVVRRTEASKTFELTIPFTELVGIWYPLVEVNFLTKLGAWIPINLIFDTGATNIVLLPKYEDFFPPGVEEEIGEVGSAMRAHAPVTKDIKVEFLNKTITCDILIRAFPCHPYIGGLFGRESFIPFGFGFWEHTRELYVTLKP